VTKQNLYTQDTIIASASAAGIGGINVIRISGPDTEDIARTVLGRIPQPRVATYKKFLNDSQDILDMGVAIYFPAPDSFTGESVLELHAHGGNFIGANIIKEITSMGARYAAPGEFSKRAYLNGKMDLIQAEAIADLISSGTQKSAKAALNSLSGVFSDLVKDLNDQLINLRLFVEAAIDFPEEELDFLSDEKLINQIQICDQSFRRIHNNIKHGQILNDGLKIAIIGLPNAGKSSLLNLISGEEAAIVTDIAGTTRDIIKIQVDIDGLSVEFIDTAGLRDNPDLIEAEGIKRTKEIIKSVDLALWIHDLSSSESFLSSNLPSDLTSIVVYNKIDLIKSGQEPSLKNSKDIYLSAYTGKGIEKLYDAIKKSIGYKNAGEGAFTARARHMEAIDIALKHFLTGKDALIKDREGEIFAEEMKLSQSALNDVTGKISSDELLGKIFSEFCIGK